MACGGAGGRGINNPARPELYTLVRLNRDVPTENVRRGDVAWVVEYLEHPRGGEDEAIFQTVDPTGHSKGIFAVPASAVEEV